ncbi:MAG: DoxX family protein [Acidobacteria bacterium]|nr:DoxX family protein [Acidobacteriota bacterium]
MKIAAVIVRSLMGLLFLFASITFFFKLITPPPPMGAMKVFTEGLAASRYLLPTSKLIELVCGLAFLTGRFVPLATVLIAPIIVNIALIHAFMDPQGLPVAIALVLANGFLAYHHRESFRPLLKP